MNIVIAIENEHYQLEEDNPIEIAIPLDFAGEQPEVHGIGRAKAVVHKTPGLIGNVCQGGSCNWSEYTLTPHSHGTHTESIAHIIAEAFPVCRAMQSCLIPASLITLWPVQGANSGESYIPGIRSHDSVITKDVLENALAAASKPFLQALVIRTEPNDPSKMKKNYLIDPPPYFTREAMEYIVSLQVRHLLCDLPSIDRMEDGGHLLNHHLFWNLPEDTHHVTSEAFTNKTITELIYVPSEIKDGIYALNLQLPRFLADAVPSRPILFPLRRKL